MGGNQEDAFNKDRAELFEALGHPTRIKILQTLEKSPLSFTELKKKPILIVMVSFNSILGNLAI